MERHRRSAGRGDTSHVCTSHVSTLCSSGRELGRARMDKPWLGSANTPSGHLLVTPCDPGNCHIYFGVQLRALPTALSIARAADRTLVLPPFEYYSGQAQEFANAFKARPAGKSPMFVPFSELYDIERLRQGGAHVVDYHEAGLQQLDVAFLSTAKGTDGKKSLAVNVPSPLDGIIEEAACRGGRDGLQSNITLPVTRVHRCPCVSYTVSRSTSAVCAAASSAYLMSTI